MTKYILGSGSTGRVNRPQAPRNVPLWEKVVHHGWTEVVHVPSLGPCWDSNAPRGGRGYHTVSDGTGGRALAHRISYEHHYGATDLPVIRHRCDNRDCIRPDHLLPGTQADNVADMVARNRQARATQMRTPLTEPQVREIKAKLAQDAPMKALGREYGVSRNTIRKIARGEAWKWVG